MIGFIGEEVYTPQGKIISVNLRESKSKYIGYSGTNKRGDSFTVLGNLNKKDKQGSYVWFLVQFEDRTKLIVRLSTIKNGLIYNPCSPSVFGVGYLGLGRNRSSYDGRECPKYNLWQSMMRRCYSKNWQQKHSYYRGCSVDKRWHNFQNFCKDLPKIGGFDSWLENKTNYHLDKDIKIKGNKVYSKDSCLFVTAHENCSKAMLGKENKNSLTGKTYQATNILTGETQIFYNVRKFARDNNFDRKCMGYCFKGFQEHHKGYIFKILED